MWFGRIWRQFHQNALHASLLTSLHVSAAGSIRSMPSYSQSPGLAAKRTSRSKLQNLGDLLQWKITFFSGASVPAARARRATPSSRQRLGEFPPLRSADLHFPISSTDSVNGYLVLLSLLFLSSSNFLEIKPQSGEMKILWRRLRLVIFQRLSKERNLLYIICNCN